MGISSTIVMHHLVCPQTRQVWAPPAGLRKYSCARFLTSLGQVAPDGDRVATEFGTQKPTTVCGWMMGPTKGLKRFVDGSS